MVYGRYIDILNVVYKPTYLVGGFKHEFYFPVHIWDNPSHWLSYFSRWLLHHQPGWVWIQTSNNQLLTSPTYEKTHVHMSLKDLIRNSRWWPHPKNYVVSFVARVNISGTSPFEFLSQVHTADVQTWAHRVIIPDSFLIRHGLPSGKLI